MSGTAYLAVDADWKPVDAGTPGPAAWPAFTVGATVTAPMPVMSSSWLREIRYRVPSAPDDADTMILAADDGHFQWFDVLGVEDSAGVPLQVLGGHLVELSYEDADLVANLGPAVISDERANALLLRQVTVTAEVTLPDGATAFVPV